MDKGYENANEQYQVSFTLGRQVGTDGKMRYWVQDIRGRKITTSTSDYNEAWEEVEYRNERS